MLDALPVGITWYSATYETADMGRTFIVPSNDWGPISGNTYQPYAIIQNLNTNDSHAVNIRDIRASLSSIDRRLILVTSDINSVLTIIEGNHRAIAIFADALKIQLSGKSLWEFHLTCVNICSILNGTSYQLACRGQDRSQYSYRSFPRSIKH